MIANIESAIPETIQDFNDHGNPDKKGVSAYNRLMQLIEFRNEKIFHGLPTSNRDIEIEIGINLGTVSFMNNVVASLPHIFRENGLNPNPHDLVVTLKNSFHVISKIAMSHLDQHASIIGLLMKEPNPPSPLNTKYFSLEETPIGKIIYVKNEAYEVIEERRKNGTDIMPDPLHGPAIVGCPAMVNFGDGSAVQKLWTWCTELAQVIYQHKYKDQVSS